MNTAEINSRENVMIHPVRYNIGVVANCKGAIVNNNLLTAQVVLAMGTVCHKVFVVSIQNRYIALGRNGGHGCRNC